MKLLQSTTALRARVALRPRSVVLRDQHGTLSAGELMDLWISTAAAPAARVLRPVSAPCRSPPRCGRCW